MVIVDYGFNPILIFIVIMLVIAVGASVLDAMKTAMYLAEQRGECINQTITSNQYNEAHNISERSVC